MKKKIEKMYLDYVNNFLTVECFSEHYGMSLDNGYRVIVLGRKINELSAIKRKTFGPFTLEELIN